MKYVVLALAMAAGSLSAQTLKGITVDKTQVEAGQTVTATVTLESAGTPNCGVRVRWGDGALTERKIKSAADMPFVATHAFSKPGDYTVVADPGRIGGSLGCIGQNASVVVKVSAPAVAVAPAAVASAGAKASTGPTCPEGWKLNAKSVVKKTGAYTCTAKAGTPTPEKRAVCPGDLTYFENSKRGQLGCRA